MSFRRTAGFTLALSLLAAVGCGRTQSQPAEPTAPASDNSVITTPDPGPVRGKAGPPSAVKEQEKEREKEPAAEPRLALPKDGGPWPWNLEPAPPTDPTRAAKFSAPKGWITGVAVAPAVRRAAVSIGEAASDKSPGWTRVLLLDLAAGTTLAEWEVPKKFDLLDISPDGRRLLLQRSAFDDPELLHLWTVADDLSLKRKFFVPHVRPRAPASEALVAEDRYRGNERDTRFDIRWARFAGPDRVVSVSKPGQLRLWDANEVKPLGYVEARPATPAVSPDGSRVAFLVTGGVALLDPMAGTVVGTRRAALVAPDVFGDPALAFSPDGKRLACIAPKAVAFLDLATGEAWSEALARTSHHSDGNARDFGWAGNRHLLLENLLHDIDFPLPVWYYHMGDRHCFRGREVWCVTPKEKDVCAVRGFELPEPGLTQRIANEMKKPELFILRAGDGMRIDVAGVPAAKQAEVKAVVAKRLTEIGYRADPAAKTVLFASVDRDAVPRTASYWGTGGGTMNYVDRPCRMKLMQGEMELWSVAASLGPPSGYTLNLKPDGRRESIADIADRNGVGLPDYAIFGTARVPPLILGPSAPLGGFGGSRLTADGVKQ